MFHLTENGPKPCRAQKRSCPLDSEHFDNAVDAQKAYETRLDRELGGFRGMVDLPCAFGTMKVMDGDLSNFKARNALISGLCGDLAKAIQNKHGGDAYFVCYGVENEDDLVSVHANDKLADVAAHAIMGSKAAPGEFMDAYGRKTLKDLQDFYGDDITLVKATPEQLQAYTTGAVDSLPNFADAVLAMDSRGESFDYQIWED